MANKKKELLNNGWAFALIGYTDKTGWYKIGQKNPVDFYTLDQAYEKMISTKGVRQMKRVVLTQIGVDFVREDMMEGYNLDTPAYGEFDENDQKPELAFAHVKLSVPWEDLDYKPNFVWPLQSNEFEIVQQH